MRIVAISIFAIGLLGGVGSVAAAETGFYVSFGAGRADYANDIGRQIREAYAPKPTYEVLSADLADGSDRAWKAAAGYRFLPWLSAELTWTDAGEAVSAYSLRQVTTPPPSSVGQIRGTYRLRGLGAALVGELPIGETFAVSLRAGAARAKLDYDENGTDIAGKPYQFHGPDDTDTVPLAGLGAAWRLDTNWELRLDWDRWFDVGTRFDLTETTNGRFDHVDLYTLNVAYRFSD